MTAIRSPGCGRTFHRTPWPPSMASARIARRARCSGTDVEIIIRPIDETNTRVLPERLMAEIERSRRQSADLPGRRPDQPVPARRRPRPPVPRRAASRWRIGGFHVSGCLSMLPVTPPEIQEAMDMGISIFAGRSRGRPLRPGATRRHGNGTHEAALQLHGRPAEPRRRARRRACRRRRWRATTGGMSSFDLGRGCPFQCSFCTIINVQGRKRPLPYRRRSRSDHSRKLQAGHHARSSSPTTTWPATSIGKLSSTGSSSCKENEGIQLSLIIQVDTQCHRIPNFIAQGALGRRLPRVHRAGERQPGQPAGRQEAPEQDHRIPQDAAGVAYQRRLDLGRLHPGLPRRHARLDPARHGDHQEELPLDILELFIPDAAARLGGSPDPVEAGRLDGTRPQQVRRPSSLRASSEDGRRGVRADLSRRPGRPITRPSTSRRWHAAMAPSPAAIRPSRPTS